MKHLFRINVEGGFAFSEVMGAVTNDYVRIKWSQFGGLDGQAYATF